jgi:hypothetical protein
MEEFIKWCFKDGISGATTLLVIWSIFNGIIGIINASRDYEEIEEEEEEEEEIES